MKQNLKSNREDFERKLLVLRILQEYYSGYLSEMMENWRDILIRLGETGYQYENHEFQKGMELIVQPNQNAIYDFNKLFLGPGKLLAPPYESAYRNPQGLLMQQETMNVRAFYLSVGLTSAKKNKVPDDFMAFELEFMGYLLYHAIHYFYTDSPKFGHYYDLFLKFLHEHTGKWVSGHCEDILKHCTTDFCKGMALITKGFIENELKSKEAIV